MPTNEYGPLTEAVYYILLSLHEPRHGYGIMQFATEQSNGRVTIGAGTVYGALNTLLEKQWIVVESSSMDKGKKTYALTATGKEVLKQELCRLKELVATGESILTDRQ